MWYYFRLGGSTRGATDVKNHTFFGGMNWQDMYEKKVGCLHLDTCTDLNHTFYWDEKSVVDVIFYRS